MTLRRDTAPLPTLAPANITARLSTLFAPPVVLYTDARRSGTASCHALVHPETKAVVSVFLVGPRHVVFASSPGTRTRLVGMFDTLQEAVDCATTYLT